MNIIHSNALDTLYGMKQIVENDRLIHGDYISDAFDPKMSTAVCKGYKYCAIGSLWAGHGEQPITTNYGTSLRGVAHNERIVFLAERPALALALIALNHAASEYMEINGIELSNYDYTASYDDIERLFESERGNAVGRPEMLEVIGNAIYNLSDGDNV